MLYRFDSILNRYSVRNAPIREFAELNYKHVHFLGSDVFLDQLELFGGSRMPQNLDNGTGVNEQLESVSFLSCEGLAFSVHACDTFQGGITRRFRDRQRHPNRIPLARTRLVQQFLRYYHCHGVSDSPDLPSQHTRHSPVIT